MTLSEWESGFRSSFQQIVSPDKAGFLLKVIPDHSEWDKFTIDIKNEWGVFRENLSKYPCCLVVLFGGIAFYRYDENTFWPEFIKVTNESLNPAKQNEIAGHFANAAKSLGLKILSKEKRVSYVGSAVHSIGVPIALWDDFLEICEWALWNPKWRSLPDNEWSDVIGKRLGGRKRLRKFLLDNREMANVFIREVLDAREILTSDPNSSIKDIAQASILRYEYFDEVPETADFFRPENPESLFRNRAKLIWNESGAQISIYLPAIDSDKLPAKWIIGELSQDAASTPDEIVLNTAAFTENISLEFISDKHKDVQRIKGANGWGLFDLGRGGGLVNANRQELPISNYLLASPEKIEILARDGFEDKESVVNDPFEFSDGSRCFITYLWPISNFADLTLKIGNQQHRIRFRARLKIEAKFFPGRFNRAAHFVHLANDRLKVEHLPVLCVSIPTGYFKDNKEILNTGFNVFIDQHKAPGGWENCKDHTDGDRELFFWRWDGPPAIKIETKSRQLKDLTYKAIDLKGDRQVSINSINFNIIYNIHLAHSYNGMDRCWQKLPGSYVLWFLLCQSTQGMKWDDLVLAKNIMAPQQRVSYYLLRKYAELGFVVQKGRLWKINQSRAVIRSANGKCEMSYCGDPSILWGLYRYICYQRMIPIEQLPIIEVIDKRGELPYLHVTWDAVMQKELAIFLKRKGIYLTSQLWNH